MERERKIFLAQPHGMCAGVRRAIDAVERLLRQEGPPIHVLHEIVHNNFIVKELASRGVHFAESLDEVPSGARLLLSAHGVGAAVEERARSICGELVDATCPLVKRLHDAASRCRPGEVLILIGHRGHPEVEGILGRCGSETVFVVENVGDVDTLPELSPETPVRLLTQTTLDTEAVREIVAALRFRHPSIAAEPSVCYATRHRQAAVRLLAEKTKLVLVIGSSRSSNSNRLREAAENAGARAFLIDGAGELPEAELENAESVGVTAGASAPETLVRQLLTELSRRGFGPVEPVIAAEEQAIAFPPPEPQRCRQK